MERGLQAVSWGTFSMTMYLILQGAVWPWIHLPGIGDVGFTLVFVVFAITHCVVLEGGRRAAIFFAVSAIVSYLMEDIGVTTGWIYGAYHYGEMLGPKLGPVPVLIPLAWFMMIYPSWMVARALLEGLPRYSVAGISAHAVTAAIVMTAWDVEMDPGMALSGNWVWEKGGAYFGVPRHNYVGWLATTVLVYWITGWLSRNFGYRLAKTKSYEALPVVVYAFLAVRYVTNNRFPALQLIGVFSMGTPALIALLRLGMPSAVQAQGEPDTLRS